MTTERGLTPAEEAMLADLFGAALDPRPVRIYNRKWWMWQPAWVTMAPDGHIWFHPNGGLFSDDFTREPIWVQAHFIHEMTHVWQYQQGIDLRRKRPPFARYRYLPLIPGKPFHRYGIEQQAEIIRDYWLLKRGIQLEGRPPLSTYRALIPFGQEKLGQTPSVA